MSQLARHQLNSDLGKWSLSKNEDYQPESLTQMARAFPTRLAGLAHGDLVGG